MDLGVAFDERAHAGPEHLDARYVVGYDSKAGLDPEPDLELLRAHGFGGDSTLVDLGAGTGTFAVAAAGRFRRVVAVDVSPAMVGAIRRRSARLENLEVVEAGFLSYEHAGPPPDVVYTRNALHHLPDFWKAIALRRLAALVPPAGVLYLRDLVFAFALRDAEAYIRHWLDSGAPSPETGWTRTELETHLRGEFSTFSWLLEPMIEEAGFAIERAWHGPDRIYAHYLCRRL
jgi:SAM-dependent methyltransferase